uniref:Uncharacterized protein n=1 Tax=Ananas comosus var. bracteatus TaxID=296719 RepID=A0A6V7Q6Z0_ANACO|nr:unnamed protein product [Ananas comosus var. bracteatus]
MSLRARAKSAIKEGPSLSSSSSSQSQSPPLPPPSSSSSSSSSSSALSQALAGTVPRETPPTGTLLASSSSPRCSPQPRLLRPRRAPPHLALSSSSSPSPASSPPSRLHPHPLPRPPLLRLATPRGPPSLRLPPARTTPRHLPLRLRPVDFVHAALSVLVFGAVALRDANVLGASTRAPGAQAREVLDALPLGVGLLCSLLFVVFSPPRATASATPLHRRRPLLFQLNLEHLCVRASAHRFSQKQQQ